MSRKMPNKIKCTPTIKATTREGWWLTTAAAAVALHHILRRWTNDWIGRSHGDKLTASRVFEHVCTLVYSVHNGRKTEKPKNNAVKHSRENAKTCMNREMPVTSPLIKQDRIGTTRFYCRIGMYCISGMHVDFSRDCLYRLAVVYRTPGQSYSITCITITECHQTTVLCSNCIYVRFLAKSRAFSANNPFSEWDFPEERLFFLSTLPLKKSRFTLENQKRWHLLEIFSYSFPSNIKILPK